MTDNDKVTKRVTRSDGVPPVEWQTGRKEGQPIRKDTRLDITNFDTTDNVQEMQDDDDEIYDEETCENIDQIQDNEITQDNETSEENSITDNVAPTNRDENTTEKNPEQIAKMVQTIKAVVDLLQKPADDILRILAQQTVPIMFLTQLPTEMEVRVVHSVSQVTAPLGHPPLRMDGKVIGFFNNPQDGTSPTVMRAPGNIFDEIKARLPPVKTLTVDREWANGNKKELWVQQDTNIELKIKKMVPIPIEWANIFFNKDLTPAEGLLEIGKIIHSWDDEEIVAIQPLLNWLRAANCKERQTQRSRTDTPVTATWIPTFPNGEEINWATERSSSIFGTNYRVNVNMGLDRSRTSTHDDNRKMKYSETDHTTKAIAAIMGRMGMSKQKGKPTQVEPVSTTDKWVEIDKSD